MARQSLPSFAALLAFESLYRNRTLTAAAKELGLTPAAISHRINDLERQLGVKLFDRVHRKYIPTAAGSVGVEDVSAAISLLHRSSAKIRARAPDDRVVVNGPQTFMNLYLPHVLQSFHDCEPSICVLLSARSQNAMDSSFEADLLIQRKTRDEINDQDIVLSKEVLVPVCASWFAEKHDGKLASFTSCGEDLVHIDYVGSDAVYPGWEDWAAMAGEMPPKTTRELWFNEEHAAYVFIQANGGIMLATEFMIRHELDEGRAVQCWPLMLQAEGVYTLNINPITKDRVTVRKFVSWLRTAMQTAA